MKYRKIDRGFRTVKNLHSISGNTVSFFKLILLYIWSHPTLWSRKHELPVSVTLKNSVGKCRIKIQNSTDLATIKTVFLDDEYFCPGAKEVKVVFDLGGYIGETALYYSLHYPEAQIFVFEPDPISYERLLQNVLDNKNIHPFNMAVSGQDNAELEFYINKDHSVGSSIVSSGDNSKEKVLVQSLTLDSLFKLTNVESVDILKFDIEGAEYEVFAHTDKLKNINTFTGEVHFDLMKQSKEELLSLFETHLAELEAHVSPSRYTLRAFRR